MSEEEKIENNIEDESEFNAGSEDEDALLDEIAADIVADVDIPEVEESAKTEATASHKDSGNAISDQTLDPGIAPARDSYPILIIDDDRWIQRIFAQYLKSWGFDHIVATNPFEGLDLAIKKKPIMIFLDIIMPYVTGDITLKFLKGVEEVKDIPVVIISGNLNKEVLKTTYKDGATGFISKPFTKDILYSKIWEVVDPSIIKRMIKDGLMDLKLAQKKKQIAGI